jgi:hypothetical protein
MADEYAILCTLHVLTKKLMDKNAKTAILTAITARSQEAFTDTVLYYPAIDSIQIIYEGNPEHSPARQLLVDFYTKFVSSAFVTVKSEAVPKGLLHDLRINLLTKRSLPKDLADVEMSQAWPRKGPRNLSTDDLVVIQGYLAQGIPWARCHQTSAHFASLTFK